MNKNHPKAKVDGKEIPIEIIEEGREIPSDSVDGVREEIWEGQSSRTVPKWKLYLPFVFRGVVLVSVVSISITLFIWVLPVLLPILLIWMVIRWVQKV